MKNTPSYRDNRGGQHIIPLSDVKSHSGIFRSALTGLTTGSIAGGPATAAVHVAGGLYGRKKGIESAIKADKEGKSDKQILNRARLSGALHGAAAPGLALGLGLGAGSYHVYNQIKKGKNAAEYIKKLGLKPNVERGKIGKILAGGTLLAAGGAALAGGLSGALGAGKAVKKKLKKRRDLERQYGM